jgi:hypothetical protein
MEEYWGDRIRPKEEYHLRILFQNINRFPMYSGDSKNKLIRACLKGIQANIFGLAELGLKWHKIPTKDRLWERTHGWLESIKVAVAYNQHEDHHQTVQWGGTSIWSIDNAVHRAIESGADLLGLGPGHNIEDAATLCSKLSAPTSPASATDL